MESSRSPLVTAPADGLTDLLGRPGPFLTLYLATDAAVENAAQLAEERWKAPRHRLAGQGVPEELLARIDPLVGPAHLEGGSLAVVATSEAEPHVEHFLEPPAVDLARWAALPAVVPLLEWRQRVVPHLVVVVDRTGADIVVMDGPGPDRDVEVRGSDDVIARRAPGGWSQRRYQQRAVDSWEHNAGEVADTVTRLADAADARLVVMAGDVRARQLVRDRLPDRLSAIVRFADGGRGPDGSVDELAEEASRLVATTVAAESADVLRRLREDLGRNDRVAAGGPAVCAALSEARVDTLVVAGDPVEEPTASFGPDPVPVAVSAADLRDLGLDDVRQAPLPDVAVRAAVGTDAAVRVVPGAPGLEQGLGALLRW